MIPRYLGNFFLTPRVLEQFNETSSPLSVCLILGREVHYKPRKESGSDRLAFTNMVITLRWKRTSCFYSIGPANGITRIYRLAVEGKWPAANSYIEML